MLIWLTAINLLTFCLYGLDKHSARRGGWRIPESTLLGCALAGGTPAAFVAQWTFRHKTRKSSFQIRLWIIFGLQIAAAVYFLHA